MLSGDFLLLYEFVPPQWVCCSSVGLFVFIAFDCHHVWRCPFLHWCPLGEVHSSEGFSERSLRPAVFLLTHTSLLFIAVDERLVLHGRRRRHSNSLWFKVTTAAAYIPLLRPCRVVTARKVRDSLGCLWYFAVLP